MIVEVFCIRGQHFLHVFAHFQKHNIARLNEPWITIDGIKFIFSIYLSQENCVRLPLRNHEFQRLSIKSLRKVVKVRWFVIGDPIVNMGQDAWNSRSTHHILAFILHRQPFQIFILPWRVIWRNTLLINLGIGGKPVEKSIQLGIHLNDFRRWVNSRLLYNNIKLIL